MNCLIPISEKNGKLTIHPDFYQAEDYVVYKTPAKKMTRLKKTPTEILNLGFLNLLEEEGIESILAFKMRMSAMVVLNKKNIRVLKPESEELEATLEHYENGALKILGEDELIPFKDCSSGCDTCNSGTCG